jgi:hypothetical protein
MDLFRVAAVAEIIGAASILFALIFAAVQIQQLRRDRLDRNAGELIRLFQSPAYISGFMRMFEVPEGATAQEVRDKGPEFEREAWTISLIMEELGILVFNRTITLESANQALGGFLRLIWARLKPWVEDERRRLNAPAYGEWFQWLVERLEESPQLKKEPAHLRYASWKP